MFAVKLLLCLYMSLSVKSQLDILRPKTVRIYQFKGMCRGYESAPIIYKDIQISIVNRIYYVSMKTVIRRNIDHDMKLSLTLSRCQSRDALDSCEKYQSIHLNHLCSMLVGNNKPWSPFIDIMKPRPSCPLKKGVYIAKNGTFDGSAFSHLPISGWYWRIDGKVLDEENEEVLTCFYIEGQLAPI